MPHLSLFLAMLAALLIMLVLLAAPADPDVTNQQGRVRLLSTDAVAPSAPGAAVPRPLRLLLQQGQVSDAFLRCLQAGKGKSQEQINSEGKAACSTPKGCCNFMQTFASCYCSEWWDGLVKTGNTDAINFHRVTLAACGIPFKGFGC